MAEVERILIVGGGIAGLTLASALHQRGFNPELVERSPTWDHIAIGAGIAVQPNGMRMMRAIGLGAAIELAMEDAWVLAEALRSAAIVENALSTCVARRKPRVKWVQQQSIATAEGLRMSPAIRNATLRERGNQMIQSHFRPLIPVP